ncbi:hypothetical protein ESCOMMO031M_23250 [Escherichia coli]
MKRNLLSSAIIVAIMSLGLTGCDDKKAETETLPPANSQPAAPAPEAKPTEAPGNDSNLLIVFYVQIMPDDFVMQLHRF